MNFTFPYETRVEDFQFGGNHLSIECLNNLDDTIDSYFEEYERSGREELFEDLCPYFGVPWPSGRALADYCSTKARNLLDKEILEIGCGLALPSLLLAKMGANILATDLHPDVPVFLEKNCERNNIVNLGYEKIDWRTWREEKFSLILASDVIYESTQSDSLLNFFDDVLLPKGEAWICDPGRPYWETFANAARVRGYFVQDSRLGNIHLRSVTKMK